MAAFVLKRRDEDRTHPRWPWVPAVTVTDHPPIPLAALPRWRRRALGHGWAKATDPITWYSHDAAASWAAVTDLHQAGQHDEVVALAVLLRWCEEQAAAGTAVWVVDEVPAATPPSRAGVTA